MKPAPFDYVAPDSLAATLAVLAASGGGARLLAGGQSLIPMLNFRLAQPAVLVDLNRLAELDYIRPDENGGLRLGAMVRQRRLERDFEVVARAPLLAEAVSSIAHPQIRNRGTLGGSLAHADPAAELPAVAVALRARLRLARAGGERWVDAASFFTGLFATALEPDEALVEVALPPAPPRTGWAFLEVSRRPGDFAQLGVAAMISLDEDGRCREARLVFLGAGTAPVEAHRATGRLAGEQPTGAAIEAAAEEAAAEIEPRADIHASADFKRHLARVLTARAFNRAAERAMGQAMGSGLAMSLPRDLSRPGGWARSAWLSCHADMRLNLQESSPSSAPRTVTLTVNGGRHQREVEPRLLLSDFLRHDLGLTGTHVGCEHGVCGACTVLLDGAPVRSCLLLALQADGREVGTVEGLAGAGGELHPLQQAFWEAHGLQCGFCTPGFLMTLVPFLAERTNPSEPEIRSAISGNLCRCTGYQHIVDAVQLAARRLNAAREE